MLAALSLSLLSATTAACRSAPPRPPPSVAPVADGLSSSSRIACSTEGDCSVCYREGTCGEPIATSDPQRDAPACHVAPAAFCLARRARCEHSVCVAR